jgi:hypothetical protein
MKILSQLINMEVLYSAKVHEFIVKRFHRDETDLSAVKIMESLLESNDNLITVD